MTTLVRAEGVRRDYRLGDEVVHAVRGVDLSIDAGDWVAIVGPSGCGKSTLLNLLGALDTPSAGRVLVKNRDVSSLSDREATRFRLLEVGFVFQRFYLVPALTALENIELPLAEAGLEKRERRARAKELLAYVGLAERARHRPAQLSGGEQQRVAIARALANRPSLVLADEPTGELDARTGAEVIALLSRLNRDGTTLVVVTHDEDLARAARRVVHMRDGVIIDSGSRDGASVSIRMQEGARERVVQWPLRTLVAWLFAGRQCDEVRKLLSRGEAMRDGTRASWAPVHLSAEELTAIERTFPPATPMRRVDPVRARTLLVRHDDATVPLSPEDARVHEAAPRAAYRWFDYGVWADVWEAPATDGVIRFEMARDGETPPWRAS